MKSRYRIPYTLDAHFGDIKTQIKYDGKGSDHYFSARGIITAFASVMFYGFTFWGQKSPVKPILEHGNIVGTILFTVGYFGIMYFSLREITIPQQYGFNTLEPFLRYVVNIKYRTVKTYSFSPYSNGVRFTGIEGTTDQGFIKFKDNTYAVLYRIVGSASYNAFDIDREQTIDGFQNLLRILPTDVTYAFITNTGGQKADIQLNHLFNQMDTETDTNMIDFIAEEIRELGGYVEKDFVALHQYMIIRGDNLSALTDAVNITKTFIEQDGLALSYIERPTQADEIKIFKQIYGGLQYSVNKRWEAFKKKDGKKSEAQTAGSLENNAKKTSTVSTGTFKIGTR